VEKMAQYITYIVFLLFLISNSAYGQNNRLENFIRAGAEDAEILSKAYLEPYPSGIGGNLNTGWYTSASTHKPLGFDIQIRGALAFVPSSDQQYNVNDLNLSKVELVDGEPNMSPTGAGTDFRGPKIIVRDKGKEVAQFNLPQGTGLDYVPTPMVQATVGLIKNTDAIVRFVPSISFGEIGTFNMQGFGLKHSISQWIPADKLLPVDISVLVGYNRINHTADFDLDPDRGAITDPTVNYDNQRVDISFDTFITSLIVGKDLPFISFYGALGYETSTMRLDLLGNYPVPVQGPAGTTRTDTVTDPFSYSQNGDNSFSLRGGFNFKLSFFNLFGEYTIAKYPIANAGIGFSFR